MVEKELKLRMYGECVKDIFAPMGCLRMLHLPRKMKLRSSKCCTCHAKAAGAHTTQSSPGGAPSAAPATHNGTEMLRVLHLPRKMRLTCSQRAAPAAKAAGECCACHAK